MLTMRHLLAWAKPPVLWEVMINNALVWMWGCCSKAFAYLRCQLLLSSQRHAALVCVEECMWGGWENAVFTHFPSCVIHLPPWCVHLARASKKISIKPGSAWDFYVAIATMFFYLITLGGCCSCEFNLLKLILFKKK